MLLFWRKGENMNRTHLKEYAKYTSLNVFGMIGLSCYILADTFFVANGLGANGLTALNLAIPIYSVIHGLGLMIGMGGSTRYSILKKSESRKSCDKIFSNAVMLALSIAIIFFLIGLFFARDIGMLLGADETVISDTTIYIKVIMLFAPMFMMNDVLVCFVRNDGNPRLAMIAMLGGSLLNIVLDYVFIFPLQMGMFGAVLATGIAPVVGCLISSIHFITKKNNFGFIVTKPQISKLIDISFLGVSSLISEVSSGVVIIIFNMIMLRLAGNVGVAAYGVVANIALVMIAIFTGISQGIQPIISIAYGAKEKIRIYATYKYAIITSVVVAVFIYIGSFYFAESIVSLFNSENNSQLLEIATNGLRIYFTGFLFAGLNIITAVFFSSVDAPMPSFIVSFLRGFVFIVPLAFVLSYAFGMNGVWLAFPLTEILTLGIAVGAFVKTKKNKLYHLKG